MKRISRSKTCNDCIYLSCDEEAQRDKRDVHFCYHYSCRLYHLEFHPKILRCDACLEEGGYKEDDIYNILYGN